MRGLFEQFFAFGNLATIFAATIISLILVRRRSRWTPSPGVAWRAAFRVTVDDGAPIDVLALDVVMLKEQAGFREITIVLRAPDASAESRLVVRRAEGAHEIKSIATGRGVLVLRSGPTEWRIRTEYQPGSALRIVLFAAGRATPTLDAEDGAHVTRATKRQELGAAALATFLPVALTASYQCYVLPVAHERPFDFLAGLHVVPAVLMFSTSAIFGGRALAIAGDPITRGFLRLSELWPTPWDAERESIG